jgi:hypothetical protein
MAVRDSRPGAAVPRAAERPRRSRESTHCKEEAMEKTTLLSVPAAAAPAAA